MYKIIRSYIRNKLRKLDSLLRFTVKIAYVAVIFSLVFYAVPHIL